MLGKLYSTKLPLYGREYITGIPRNAIPRSWTATSVSSNPGSMPSIWSPRTAACAPRASHGTRWRRAVGNGHWWQGRRDLWKDDGIFFEDFMGCHRVQWDLMGFNWIVYIVFGWIVITGRWTSPNGLISAIFKLVNCYTARILWDIGISEFNSWYSEMECGIYDQSKLMRSMFVPGWFFIRHFSHHLPSGELT